MKFPAQINLWFLFPDWAPTDTAFNLKGYKNSFMWCVLPLFSFFSEKKKKIFSDFWKIFLNKFAEDLGTWYAKIPPQALV